MLSEYLILLNILTHVATCYYSILMGKKKKKESSDSFFTFFFLKKNFVKGLATHFVETSGCPLTQQSNYQKNSFTTFSKLKI